ncbi:uncharacterized protein LOC141852050 [Brevipalpus obovatus]|uniref:uncharacterized protein LOC141852050 n=1 Tax=Brevipalpus obovatus TaxID=246614 RepID=UPI003D9E1AC1
MGECTRKAAASDGRTDNPIYYEDHVDDDYEDDDGDEGIDDEDDDESCSDQSSTTSTSTSNNQRVDGGRVCDCCYCEVFGHGMPAVAPTSRNYNEMRERLRSRLNKRKAERGRCENAANLTANGSDKRKELVEKEDNRDLEELLNYIEGTSSRKVDKNSKEKKKKDKPKKKKEKSKDRKVSTITHVNPNNNLHNTKSSLSSFSSSSPSSITITSSTNTSEILTHNSTNHVTKQHHQKVVYNNHENSNSAAKQMTRGSLNITELIHPEESQPSRQNNSSERGTRPRNTVKTPSKKSNTNRNNNKSNPQAITPEQSRITPQQNGENVNSSARKTKTPSYDTQISAQYFSQRKAPTSNSEPNSTPKCVHTNESRSKTNVKASKRSNSTTQPLETIIQDLTGHKLIMNDERTNVHRRNNKNGTSNNNDSSIVSDAVCERDKNSELPPKEDILLADEVFLPKSDIDLENGELDEIEKEVEAFKRFCFNSVPRARKDKVNVDLKDILIKKRPVTSNYGDSQTISTRK